MEYKEFKVSGAIVSDTGWQNAGGIPSRGIYDFKRVMVINTGTQLNENDLEFLKVAVGMPSEGYPGNTGVHATLDRDTVTFYTTMDSSD